MGLARVRRTRIDQLAEEGNRAAKLVRVSLDDPDRFITACQLGITLATTEDNSGLFGTAAPELVEALPVPDNSFLPDASATDVPTASFVSHNESGHNQMLVQLATYME